MAGHSRKLATWIGAVLLASAGAANGAEVVEHLGAAIHQPVYGARGMVVSHNELASQAGAQVLRDGGNAVDAAVATALTLSVALPRAGNIGGDGFMLIYLAKSRKALVIDYRSVAPRSARTAMYVDEDGKETEAASKGYIAPSVPGTIAGLYRAQRAYGRLPWARVVAPAIALARDGMALSYEQVTVFGTGKDKLAASAAARAAFSKPDGSAYRPGEVLKQPDLARTLKIISDNGADGFYRGEIATLLAADMKRHGGLITAEDLAAYKPVEREALVGTYRGLTVFAVPPASSGGTTLLEMLNILEPYDLASMRPGSAASLHLLAEVMKLGAADRVAFLGDTDFVKAPVQALISKPYARTRGERISLTRATEPKVLGDGDPWKFESPSTTHLSVADEEGNAVSNTFTLGSDFGSGVMVEGAGFLLNNQMNNYAHEATAKAARTGKPEPLNALAPGKRMLSSMTPAIVMKDGRPWLVTGSPGGSTIIDTVLQILVDVIDFKLNIADATHLPRIYQGWTNELVVEPALSPDTADALARMGHKVKVGSAVIGSTQSIVIDPGRFSGAADSRRPDAAAVAY